MLALKILDIKDFTTKLLIGDTFDAFWVSEISVTTYITFTIEGNLQKDFFDSDTIDSLQLHERNYAQWKEVKPFCFQIMKGKRTPLQFKINFILSRKNTHKLLVQTKLPYTLDDIFSLNVNFHYDGTSLTCTTGSSLRIFTLDKTLDQVWDDMVVQFFKQQNIPVELL